MKLDEEVVWDYIYERADEIKEELLVLTGAEVSSNRIADFIWNELEPLIEV